MPNWVRNRVIFYCEREKIEEIKKAIAGDERAFDFNTVIPMPESLNVDDGIIAERAEQCFIAEDSISIVEVMDKYHLTREKFDEYCKLGKVYVANKLNYGYRSWYGWRINNWGTKWNACESRWIDDRLTLLFVTAWATPRRVFDALSEKFPDISFDAEFADEDIGNNCGILSYSNGKFEAEHTPAGEEGENFALKLWDYTDEEIAKYKEECEEDRRQNGEEGM